MAKLTWGDIAAMRQFEVGVRNGVLFRKADKPTTATFSATAKYAVGDVVLYGTGTSLKYYVCKTAITTPGAWDASKWTEIGDVNDGNMNAYPWNGLISVSENPDGADATDLYADDAKYLSIYSKENYNATIEAYMYPEEFEACNGYEKVGGRGYIGQQSRESFAFCYRTLIGDADDDDIGFKVHIVYGCKAQPSSQNYETIDDNPDAMTFSWEIAATEISFTVPNDSKFGEDKNETFSTQSIELVVLDDPTKTPSGAGIHESLTANEWNAVQALIYEATETRRITPDIILAAIAAA